MGREHAVGRARVRHVPTGGWDAGAADPRFSRDGVWLGIGIVAVLALTPIGFTVFSGWISPP